MKKRLGQFIAGRMEEQAGQALVLVLVFFLMGSLTLTPLLMQMGTALKTQTKYENKTDQLYTADAGIETGLWRIKYDFMGPDYDPYDYTTVWPYETDPVNHATADVLVQNVWLPSNVTLDSLGLDSAEAKAMIESEKLIITGTSGAVPGQPFHIKMDFMPGDGDNLTIKSIGVWLPQGFTYTAGSSELEHLAAFNPCRPDAVNIEAVPGGESVVWSYNPPYPLFTAFPNYAVEDGTLTFTFSFNYSPPATEPDNMPLAITWATTDVDPTCVNVNDVPLAWDTDMRYYKVTSTSGGIDIETYSSKSQLRNLGNGIAGDYVAIGNSVMLDNFSPYDKRDTLLTESSTDVADVSPIPSDGDVLYAYLYWSGFRHSQSIWSDTCADFTKWYRNSVDGSQTRAPIGDGDITGTWNPTPAAPTTSWDKVDETTANDADYMMGTTDGGGYKLFTFSAFTVLDQPITSLTIHFRAKDYGSTGTNNIRGYIKVNGSYYSGATNNPGGSFGDYVGTWTTNPATSAPWTAAEINGTGTNPLQQFGVYSTDLNPDIQVSMVYAEVAYTSYWSIYSSSQFEGHGANNAAVSPRFLTLHTAVNLSSYTPGTIAISWAQTEAGTLESNDTLYYALSKDNGATWSSDIEAFHDDSPASPFYALVPENYMTAAFKIRFYYNFNATDESVRLDNIYFYYMPPDTSVAFKINSQQVYFDGNGDPQAGAQPITSSYSAVLINATGSTAAGYSYACYKDVTDLVKKYPVVPDEAHHTGNYEFTVGDISGDTGEYISYAGWSLILIYGSPGSAGRYIYLRDIHDIFAFNPGGENLDFDSNGVPGGDVTGFLFPEPVRNKLGNIIDPTAAKITCFVGEGDENYTGDSLVITGQQSGASSTLSNSASPANNVWNSASPGVSYAGVDVDTFIVPWAAGILTPKDTSLHMDMQSGTDAWNLIYFIMSVRSETVTSGTGHYSIDSN